MGKRSLSKNKKQEVDDIEWGIVDRIFYFRQHYPADWSRPQYQTDDKIISYKEFNMMMKGAKANRAMDKLTQYEASLIAHARCNTKDSDSFDRIVKGWRHEAHGHSN